MPIRHWIDKENRLIRAEVSGSFSMDQILATVREAICHPDFEPGFNILSDHTRVTEFITADQIKDLTQHISLYASQLWNARWAVVTAAPASFGMMSVLSAYLEEVPMSLRAFGNEAEAMAWLHSAPGG